MSHIIICTLVLSACQNNGIKKSESQKTDSPTVYRNLQKPCSTFSDTIIIRVPSAVFYNPDTIQLEKIKTINKEPVFKSLVHNCFYQMRNAKMVLKQYWPRVHITDTKARWLLFIHADKSKTLIDLNNKNDICGIFLFDPQKNPLLIDMMNIDTELGFYFKKP